MCLMEQQAKYVFKKVEEDKAISINVTQHEQSFNREHDNPYERVILNKCTKMTIRPHTWNIGLYFVTMLGMCITMKIPHKDWTSKP